MDETINSWFVVKQVMYNPNNSLTRKSGLLLDGAWRVPVGRTFLCSYVLGVWYKLRCEHGYLIWEASLDVLCMSS